MSEASEAASDVVRLGRRAFFPPPLARIASLLALALSAHLRLHRGERRRGRRERRRRRAARRRRGRRRRGGDRGVRDRGLGRRASRRRVERIVQRAGSGPAATLALQRRRVRAASPFLLDDAHRAPAAVRVAGAAAAAEAEAGGARGVPPLLPPLPGARVGREPDRRRLRLGRRREPRRRRRRRRELRHRAREPERPRPEASPCAAASSRRSRSGRARAGGCPCPRTRELSSPPAPWPLFPPPWARGRSVRATISGWGGVERLSEAELKGVEMRRD